MIVNNIIMDQVNSRILEIKFLQFLHWLRDEEKLKS